jgi:hypothetical protein
MVYQIILAIVFSIFASIAKAICDLSSDDKIKFKPETYWVKSKSWVNKWKNGDPKQGEKFWKSSGWLVALTDAWHLFGLIERISLAITYTFSGLLIAKSIWFIFFPFGCYILFASIFHIFYTYVFVKK